MNIETKRKTERFATTSRVLGILSFLLILFPLGLFLWTRMINPEGSDISLLGWAVLAVFMMLGSLLTGIPGCILARVALNRNKTDGEDPTIKKVANTGLVFSLLGILGALVILGYAWMDGFNNPNLPPNPITPMPTTTVP